MDEIMDSNFWEIIENEFGIQNEMDMFYNEVVQVICPKPGVIILLTNEADHYGQE